MTEVEWTACTNPMPMLLFLGDKATERKLRLYIWSCIRRVWPRFEQERYEQAMSAAIRFADGEASWKELETARVTIKDAFHVVGVDRGARAALDAAPIASAFTVWPKLTTVERAIETAQMPDGRNHSMTEQNAQAYLVRDIFGNPFRPVTFDPAWRTTTVTSLAQAIYDERAFDRMPILADALEDAGCTNGDILGHCRGGGEHVRGCWVVDLVLGKV